MKNYLIFISIGLLLTVAVGCSTSANYKKDPSQHKAGEIKQDNAQKMLTAAEQIARKILEKIDTQDHKIAIIEFSELYGNEYAKSAKGKLISERLITNLVNSGQVTVIERGQLEKVIDELKLNLQGLIDSSSAKEVGTLLGIDSLVTGTIIELAHSSEINARMIDTESGKILSAITVQDQIELPNKVAEPVKSTQVHTAQSTNERSSFSKREGPAKTKNSLSEKYKKLFNDKKFRTLIKETKREINQNDDNIIARLFLGMSLVRTKNKQAYTQSIEHLRYVLKNGKGHPEIRKEAAKHLIFALIKSDRRKEAKTVIDKAKRHITQLNNREGIKKLLRELDN